MTLKILEFHARYFTRAMDPLLTGGIEAPTYRQKFADASGKAAKIAGTRGVF